MGERREMQKIPGLVQEIQTKQALQKKKKKRKFYQQVGGEWSPDKSTTGCKRKKKFRVRYGNGKKNISERQNNMKKRIKRT